MLLRILGAILVGLGIVFALRDQAVGGAGLAFLLLVVVGGGAVGAAIMILLGRRPHQAPVAVPDAFGRNQPDWPWNVSRIRVAGLGGLGMVAVAVTMALTMPAIGVSLGLGLVGGFLVAIALIPYRRAHLGDRR